MRFRFITVACLLLTLSICTFAQEKTQNQKKTAAASLNSETAACEARSRRLWEDFRNRNKADLAATLGAGFRALEEGESDFSDTKGYLSTLDEFELKSYVLSDYTVTLLGTGAVLVDYHARYEGVAAGQTTQGNSGFSEVWVRRGGNWKIQYLQETYLK
jgi:outer membrane lipoprotein-sorting protein